MFLAAHDPHSVSTLSSSIERVSFSATWLPDLYCAALLFLLHCSHYRSRLKDSAMTCSSAARSSWQTNPPRWMVPSDQTTHRADLCAQSFHPDDVGPRRMGHSDHGMADRHRVIHQGIQEMINQQVQRLGSQDRDVLDELHQDFASFNRYAKQYGHHATSTLPRAPKARK